MKNLESRRIVGIIFDVSEISSVDFSKTIEDSTLDLVYSIDGMTSIMWDINEVGEDPAFVTGIVTRSRLFTYIELDSIKSLGYWK